MTMMPSRLFPLLLLFTCISTAFAVGIKQEHGLVGGYAPADVNDPFVVAVAKFAVDSLEKNKDQYTFLASVPSDTHLVGTVLQAQQQVRYIVRWCKIFTRKTPLFASAAVECLIMIDGVHDSVC